MPQLDITSIQLILVLLCLLMVLSIYFFLRYINVFRKLILSQILFFKKRVNLNLLNKIYDLLPWKNLYFFQKTYFSSLLKNF
jgi:hypothetical protein